MREDEEPRVNREITAKQVLVVDDKGAKLGVIDTEQAVVMAEERLLDLVEVAPMADPPVCRILDFGKFRYKQQKKEKDARKKQKVQTLKEIKMRPKIDEHDYDFKVKAIKNFLENGHRVKVSVFFRGREMNFLDKGKAVLARVVSECESVGKSEGEPRMEGRYMRLMLTPSMQAPPKKAEKKVLAEPKEEKEISPVNPDVKVKTKKNKPPIEDLVDKI
jgi:translation initiation factor IF-3